MQRVQSFSLDEVLTSAQVNAIQDQALGIAQVSAFTPRPVLSIAPGATDLIVGPVAAFAITPGATTLLATSGITTVPLTGLTSNQWYYVYAYDNSGALGFEYSTNVPDGSLIYHASDTSRRYIGCFRSLTSTTAKAFRSSKGRYTYRGQHGAGNVLVNNAGPTAGTTVAATAFVPLHCSLIEVQLVLYNNSTDVSSLAAGTRVGSIFFPGDATPSHYLQCGASPNSNAYAMNSDTFLVECDAFNQIRYAVDSNCLLDVLVTGFVD